MVRTLGRRALAGGAAAALAGCAGTPLPMLPDYRPQSYRLGTGDLLHIVTFGEAQLTGDFRVDDQGRIAMPLVGSVAVAGRSPAEVEAALGEALTKGGFLQSPHVTVEVAAYRPIFVLGEVTKPGQYPYQPGMTLLTAVAVAGGFTYRAVQGRAEVVRTVDGAARRGSVTESSFLAPGDVIEVPERFF